MKITLQKYGGSSVADRDKIHHVARRVAETHASGRAVVVVVSAMGDTTSELLELARCLSTNPSRRELDMLLSSGERISGALLALAVQELGVEAISLSGAQSGIRTTDQHFNAEIREVVPDRVHAELAAGRVVIVAGYQGESPAGETTTLGRGGSDTSAVAVAAALGAERCEIYSDVAGVYTADPRIVDRATPLPRIAYEEMLELARHGASVLHPPAVEHARDHGLPIQARSTFSDARGTLVTRVEPSSDAEVRGVACHQQLVWVSIDRDEALKEEVLEAAGGPEVYHGGELHEGREDILLAADALADSDGLAATLSDAFGEHIRVENTLGSVSAVGYRVGGAEEALRGVARLGDHIDVPIAGRFVSDHALTTLMAKDAVPAAARALHGALVEPRILAAGGP